MRGENAIFYMSENDVQKSFQLKRRQSKQIVVVLRKRVFAVARKKGNLRCIGWLSAYWKMKVW